MTLLEVKQSEVARDGLEAATAAILELFEGIREGAAQEDLRERWKPSRNPSMSALKRVLELPPEAREELEEAVKADLAFPDGFADREYRFCFQQLEPEIRKPAQELLASIYDNVFCRGTGFEFGPGRFVNRGIWEDEFHGANPKLTVCPTCAAYDLPPRIGEISLNDVDHYLPRSKYPALSVHSLNLVLVCKPCNTVLKGGTDPLAPADGPCCLCDIWFPYVRAGLDEVELEFDTRAEVRKIEFAGDEAAVARARRHDEIFELVERWSPKLTSIQDDLPEKLMKTGADGDPESVKEGLEELRRTAMSSVGEGTQTFVESQYYGWLLRNPAAFRALVKEVQASA